MPSDPQLIVQEIVRRPGTDRGSLLDIAREVQARLGWVSAESIKLIAEALSVKPVQVRDALSFYSFLSLSPTGRSTVRLSTCVAGKMRGSGAVEEAIAREVGMPFGQTSSDGAITLARTSCTGMCDQSPSALVEGHVLTNLTAQDARRIVDGLLDKAPFSHTRVESNIRQAGPVIFAPLERGTAIRAALSRSPQEVIEEIGKSRLRGRGGAGFPTGMKWDFCRKAQGAERYLICNCDEGEMGTFKDRVIITEVPDLLFEGMTIGGYALGARQGILYLRGEYEYLQDHLERVLERRRRLGLLGASVCGREGFEFDIRIQIGAGAYICGEESALLESLEGKRGAPRDRPPYPVQRGYRNQPTAVNNVETLCCVARILEKGADWFARMGTRDSTGTKLLSVSGRLRAARGIRAGVRDCNRQAPRYGRGKGRAGSPGGGALRAVSRRERPGKTNLLRRCIHWWGDHGVQHVSRHCERRARVHCVFRRRFMRLVCPLPHRHNAAFEKDG